MPSCSQACRMQLRAGSGLSFAWRRTLRSTVATKLDLSAIVGRWEASALSAMRNTVVSAASSRMWLLVSSSMLVSGGVSGLALPAYTGGRRLDLEQDGDHAPGAGGPAPGAQRRKSGGGNRHAAKALANLEVRA